MVVGPVKGAALIVRTCVVEGDVTESIRISSQIPELWNKGDNLNFNQFSWNIVKCILDFIYSYTNMWIFMVLIMWNHDKKGLSMHG